MEQKEGIYQLAFWKELFRKCAQNKFEYRRVELREEGTKLLREGTRIKVVEI